MAIIASQTLGSTRIYQVDQAPTFDAPSGSIAIYDGTGAMWARVEGQWLALTATEFENFNVTAPGTVFDSSNTTTYLGYANVATWATSSYSPGNWSKQGNFLLKYNGSLPARVLVQGYHAIQDDNKSHTNRLVITKNSATTTTTAATLALPRLENLVSFLGTTNAYGTNYVERAIDVAPNDTLGMAYSSLTSGGNATPTTLQSGISLHIVDHGRYDGILLSENWESGSNSFVANGWTTVQAGQANTWVVSGALVSGVGAASGSYYAYITNNAAATPPPNTYNNASLSRSYIYKDVTFPAGTAIARLTFDWRCAGENGAGADQYDFGRVWLAPTSTTPTAGNLLINTYQIGATKYNNQATWARESFYITEELSALTAVGGLGGTTRRLIFGWNNDASVGTNPPIGIDNIKLESWSF